MKLRTFSYSIGQGVKNAYKNKLMSIISIGMVSVSLIIFGMFFILLYNLNSNINTVKEDYQIEVYCVATLTYNDPLVTEVERQIMANPNVDSVVKISKEEAYEKTKTMLADRASVLDNLGNEFLPISFTIKLKDLSVGSDTGAEFQKIPNVDKVNYPQQEMEVINYIAGIAYAGSLFIGGILAFASMFIISNTIRLTVFARKRDINIMKFVGASDGFVRLPFLIEGLVIGVVGASIAFLAVGYSYMALIDTINRKLVAMNIVSLRLLDFTTMAPWLALFMIGLGAFVGIVGSAVSVRKHLRV